MMKQMKDIAENEVTADATDSADATKIKGPSIQRLRLPPMTSQTLWTTPFDIECAIRHAFKTDYSSSRNSNNNNSNNKTTTASTIDRKDLHSYAIYANQLLQEQSLLWNNSSTCVTNGLVRVTATSQC